MEKEKRKGKGEKRMKKISKEIKDNECFDFYDKLTEKQREKFDNEKESFTIDFSEVSSIYSNLNDHQTRILFLAVAMFASSGKKAEIDSDILEDLNSDPAVLLQFNSMANRIKNNTKSWLNGQGKRKKDDEIDDITYDNKKGYWKANPTADVKSLVKKHNQTLSYLNEYLSMCCKNKDDIPDIFSDDFDCWFDDEQ